ncbi:hypothetical protein MIR68_000670 [Amoeboaphelidium protococcarum]|nr:hypothetical protein MIR68_000670 [Amoeboaphelidium protococcarum]
MQNFSRLIQKSTAVGGSARLTFGGALKNVSRIRAVQQQQQLRFYAAKDFPAHNVIKMPALSPTMTSGNLGTWHKKVGDEVVAGDVLVEIETDKAQMDFECQEEGFIAKILVDAGAKDVGVNTPIAVMVEDKEDVEKFQNFKVSDAASPAKSSSSEKQVDDNKPEQVESKADASIQSTSVSDSAQDQGYQSDRVFASPVARKLAGERSINLSDVKGSGPNSRIVKSDIENYKKPSVASASGNAQSAGQKQQQAAAPQGGEYEDIPITNMRKVIATRLQESKQQLPHYYLTTEVVMDKVLKLRQVFNEQADGKFKLSVNDFIIKAAAMTMKEVPEVNSAWLDSVIRRYHNVDISIAVSTPSGLITPIVKNAHQKGLASISQSVKDLAAKARQNKLQPQEYQGGTFTISNLGMYGVKSFTAIINPPQSCILAVGATEKRMLPDSDTEKGFAVVQTMHVTLSCDHRTVDGAVGAQWLAKFKENLENPLNLML